MSYNGLLDIVGHEVEVLCVIPAITVLEGAKTSSCTKEM